MVQFIVNNFATICGVVSAVLTAGGVIAGLFARTKKASKTLKAIGGVVEHLPTYIRTAEKLGGTGEDKKAYVIEQVLLFLRADGVTPSKDQLDSISKQIDEQVRLTKSLHVMVRQADSTTTGA